MPKQNIHVHNVWWKKRKQTPKWPSTMNLYGGPNKKDDYLFICRWIFEASHEIKGQCAQ